MKKIALIVCMLTAALLGQGTDKFYKITLINGSIFTATFKTQELINGQHIITFRDSSGQEIKINRSDIINQTELIQSHSIEGNSQTEDTLYKLSLLISPGFGYSHFTSIDRYFNLGDFIGFHLGADLQLTKRNSKSPYYFTLGADIYYCHSRVVYTQGAGSADLLEGVDRKLIHENPSASYTSLVFYPTLGSPVGEVSIGLGKVFYNIKKYVSGEISPEFERGLIYVNQDYAIWHSNRLANLDSENAYAIRWRFIIKGYNEKARTRVWLGLQYISGAKYYSNKTGWIITDSNNPDLKNRMSALSIFCQLRYTLWGI